jgi:hypothetical protein
MFTSYFPNQTSTLFCQIPDTFSVPSNQYSKGLVCWVQDYTLKIFGMENKEENAGADRSICFLFYAADGQVWGKYGYIDDNSVIRYIIF